MGRGGGRGIEGWEGGGQGGWEEEGADLSNLSKTAICGPVLTDLHREVAALWRWIAML